MAERMAVNAPIQGTAADIIKIAMKKVNKTLVEQKLDKDSELVLQVHDELIFEVKKGVVEKIIPIVQKEMESSSDMVVPLLVHITKGDTLGDLKKVV